MGKTLQTQKPTFSFREIAPCLFALFIDTLGFGFEAIIPFEILLWIVSVPLALAVQTAGCAMLTSFSDAVDENSQGWAMGISGSIVALSFAVIGLSPNLIPFLGVKLLIFIGAIFMLFGSILMLFYCKKISRMLKR